MKKAKSTQVFMMVIILVASIILTTTAMADSESDYILWDPCDGFEALPDAQAYCGEYKGGGYQIEIPDNWNGDLLVWAHGYRDHPTYVWVDPPPVREWLIENGYAWAASSFTTNGNDITTGVKDTKTLVQFFKDEFGKPEHVYLSGESMGATITAVSIEQWPNLYDGGLSVCSTLTPYIEIDFVWDYYVLSNALAGFDATYPVPADYLTSGASAAVEDALALSPGSYPYELNDQGMLLKNALEIRSGGERPLWDQAFLIWYGFIPHYFDFSLFEFFLDMDLPSVNGVPFNNWDTVYQYDMDPALSPEEQALNDMVFRIQRDPQALHPNGLKNIPVPNGNLKVPMISLHGIGDLLVNIAQEQIYARRVADHGASDFLVQRAIRELLHCEFTADEYMTALNDLDNWVETGVKPAGDDILDPVVVSDPFFGCQFTTEGRDYTWIDPILAIPPCP